MLFQVLCGFEPIFYTTHPNEEPENNVDIHTLYYSIDDTVYGPENTLPIEEFYKKM